MSSVRVDEIIIPDSIASDYTASEPFNSLTGIRRLNVIVGPNNSGKSRLMRELFAESQNLMVSTSDEDETNARDAVRKALQLIPAFQENREIYTPLAERLRLPFGFHGLASHPNDQRQYLKGFHRPMQWLQNITNTPHTIAAPSPSRSGAQELMRALNAISLSVDKLSFSGKPTEGAGGKMQEPPAPQLQDAKFVYIPTLRGMRLSTDGNDLSHAYFDRTWMDYFADRKKRNRSVVDTLEQAREEYCGKAILTGLNLYQWLTDRLLGSLKERELVRDYQQYLSKTFFRELSVALIPRRDHDTVNIKIGNEKERPVQSLGDGLQQLIIMTLPLFEHRDVPLFLFIEEPDLFLHPGFQRVLIEAFTDDPERQLNIFVTTHSNHFLDLTVSESDCAIFRCEKVNSDDSQDEHDPKFRVSNTEFGDMSILEHIGVRPSSVLLANCTIWVEGITDRLYFSKYVELTLKQRGVRLIENLHYSFVEYGGANITHWSFLDEEGINVERLCARLMLIADEDKGKLERHDKLEANLGDRYIKLPVREVENLLTPNVIQEIIYDYEGDEISVHPFNSIDYATELLGRFIDEKVLVDKTKSKRFGKRATCYADTSGTVKDKLPFCKKALSHIDGLKSLSAEAKRIANEICTFIERQNGIHRRSETNR